MSDFFARLETELRVAAERPPRRVRGVAGSWAAPIAAAAAVGLALVLAVAMLGGGDDARDRAGDDAPATLPVGTVIPKGKGAPPRESDSTVVATGESPAAGPWQLETYTGNGLRDPKTGEEYEPAGLPCLLIAVRQPTTGVVSAAAGQCGLSSSTPGFMRAQMNYSSERRVVGRQIQTDEVLVYGRAPEETSAVVITVEGERRLSAETSEGPPGVDGDFFVIPVKPDLAPSARINWLDADGNPGSRGLELLPPITTD